VYYDALTTAAVRDELTETLSGGRVQRVVRPTDLSVGLEVYAGQRYQLLLNAEAQSPGVLLTDIKLRRGTEKPSPLSLLLRKYVEGARLQAVEQPDLERILWLTFSGPEGTVTLVCEIIGRLSNIILLAEDGTVMDAAKRVPSSVNRYRTVLPRQSYVPPPPQAKENPLLLTPARLREILAASESEGRGDRPLWRILVDGVAGISPLLAREIVYRALGTVEPDGSLDDGALSRLVTTLVDMMHLPETHGWSPTVAYEVREGKRRAVAYAAYDLTHLPDREPEVEGISSAIRRVQEGRQGMDAYAQVRRRLRGMIAEQIKRQEGRLASLRQGVVPADELEDLQRRGQAVLAMAWAIAPGQRELVAGPDELGEEADGKTWHIDLDPSLTPAENAQRYFREYQKRKAAAEQVPSLIRQSEMDLEYLRQLDTEVTLAENRAQLDEVEASLQEAGYISSGKKAGRKAARSGDAGGPSILQGPDGTTILVGRNSRQNDEVTFRRAAPDDIWLHAHGVPGAHVIIKNSGAAVSEETLLMAARLAAYYSAARQEARVQVDFTERRHVRHIPGGRPGMVTYTHENTLVVVPEPEPPDR
jgi:predicted ribosome quality control (RQC) complex YloA/Tae2 family protein